MVTPLAEQVQARLRAAMAAVLPAGYADADPQVRRSDRADFQANGLFTVASKVGISPRELAGKVAAAVEPGGLLATCEASGPGFVNVTVQDAALLATAAARLADARLGVPAPERGRVTVIDYSQPNVAKEMHVGHLRSTIIGDALARVLGFLGAPVIRQNHLGDWGTQFGMLIQYLDEYPDAGWDQPAGVPAAGSASRLNALYRAAREAFDADPSFAERARARVVALQAGDPGTRQRWAGIVAESKRYFNEVYAKLGVLLTDTDAVGESFYNPFLDGVARELAERGVAVVSDGALCVFVDGVRGPDGMPVPLIVRKRDGGYGYAATDLAALRYRVHKLGARRVLYVVDARQALHFRMVFATARRAGWLPEDVEAVHVAFGAVLGPDGRPFKTRSGETVRLVELLDEATARARTVVAAKSRHLDPAALEHVAWQVGIGAVKYADLATSRTSDYAFDLDRMVTLTGNTGVYVQYAHARVRSILRAAGPAAGAARVHPEVALAPAERALALTLDGFAAAVLAVGQTLEPHRLCGYLYELAQAFTAFYEACPVLRAPSPMVRDNRLVLCRLAAETFKLGLELLGIAAPDQL